LLKKRCIPAVYLDLGTPDRYVSNINIDYETGIRQVVGHLLGLGHTRIGYLSGPKTWHSARLRVEAFEAAARGKAEIHVSDAGGSGVKEGYVACSRLMTAFRPTAVACFSDQLAIGALHAAHDRGYSLPAELSVTGFDDISFAENAYPPLTTVSVPKEELGRLAASALVAIVAAESAAGTQHELSTTLVVRSSTAPPFGGRSKR
jgi:LacI family transcriptional regulator